MMTDTLSSYLNERYVRANEDKHGEPQHDTISEFFDLSQNIDLKDNLEAIWKGLPKDVSEHLSWEKIVFDQFTKARHKALYIEDRYQKLLESKNPQTAAIMAFLTPDQGYIINAYLLPPGELLTIEKMKQWKQAYETYPESDGIVDHWSAFLLEAANISAYDYLFDMIIRDSSENTFKSRPVNFTDVIEGTLLINSISVQATAASRAERLQQILHHPILNELTTDQRNQVFQQVLEISCDFHDLFYAFYQSFIKKQPFTLTEQEIAAFTERSTDFDNAAEELASLLFQNAEFNFENLFKPGFRKSAEALPILPPILEPRDWSGHVLVDPRKDTTIFNGGEVIRTSIRSLEVVTSGSTTDETE